MKLFLVLFSFWVTSVFGQINIDSLTLELESASNDSLKYYLLTNLAFAYEESEYPKADQYYDNAVAVATSNKWYKKVGNCYFNKAFYYHYKLGSDTAFEQVKLAQKWYVKAGNDVAVLNCMFTIGTFWMNVEKFDSSSYYLEKAITFGNSINDTVYLHKIHNNLGLLYHYLGLYDKGIENLIKAVKIKEQIQSPDIGSTYINLGLSYNSANQRDQAILYYTMALNIFKDNNNQKYEALCLNNIGEVYEDINTDSSLFYYNQAYEIFEVLNDSNSMARSHNFFAKIYVRQEKYSVAIIEYEKALEMIPTDGLKRLQVNVLNNYTILRLELNENNSSGLYEIILLAKKSHMLAVESGLIQGQSIAARVLFNAYSKTNQSGKANPYGNEYITLNDSINNQARIDALTEQHIRFETEKKQIEIDLLNTENQLKSSEIEQGNELQQKQSTIISLLVSGVIVTIIFIGVIFILYRNLSISNVELNKKNDLIVTQKEEKEVLLKEIHHRVKNNLQIIWSLLDLQAHSITDESVKMAINDGKNRVNSMAMIHTMLYQNDDAGNIFFKEYVEKLTAQIKSTFTDSDIIEVVFNIPTKLKFDIDASIPLGLLITELFTNALKYGVKDVKKPIISMALIVLNEDNYTFIITDNGGGLPDGFEIKKLKSLGLQLVTNLAKQLLGKMEFKYNNGAEFIVHFKGKSFSID